MAFINEEQKEIHNKITYWGPYLGGKTTSIAYIHSRLQNQPWQPDDAPFEPSLKAARRLFDEDRPVSVLHDHLPMKLGEVRGYRLAFGLYAPTGLPASLFPQARASRALLAKATDVFVFVASSMPEDLDANREALEELRSLEGLSDVQVVFQMNKQDLPGAWKPEVVAKNLGLSQAHVLGSSAITGEGVFDALRLGAKICLEQLRGG